MDASRYTCKRVMSLTWRQHVADPKTSWIPDSIGHVTHINVSCHTWKWVMLQIPRRRWAHIVLHPLVMVYINDVYLHIRIRIYVCLYMYINIYIYMYIYIYIHVYTHKCIYKYPYIYIYMYMIIYMQMNVNINIYVHI